MTTGEKHAQLVVEYLLFGEQQVQRRLHAAAGKQTGPDLSRIFLLQLFAVEDIQRLIPGYAEQPARRVVRNALVLPLGKGLGKRVLYDVFGQVNVFGGEDPGQGRDQLPGFMPEEVVDKLMDGRLVDWGYFPSNLRNAVQRAEHPLYSDPDLTRLF